MPNLSTSSTSKIACIFGVGVEYWCHITPVFSPLHHNHFWKPINTNNITLMHLCEYLCYISLWQNNPFWWGVRWNDCAYQLSESIIANLTELLCALHHDNINCNLISLYNKLLIKTNDMWSVIYHHAKITNRLDTKLLFFLYKTSNHHCHLQSYILYLWRLFPWFTSPKYTLVKCMSIILI